MASNNKNWGTARLIAFDRALLDSMRQCVEFQEVEITSAMERFLRRKIRTSWLGYNKDQVTNVIAATKDESLVKKSPTLQALATSAETSSEIGVRRNY